VFGIGGLGHLAVQIAKARGAEVYAFDIGEEKLQLARELGAVACFSVTEPDLLKQIRKLGGMHVAVVTSAAKAAFDIALKCLRPTGTLAVVGLPADPLTFPAAVGTRDDMRAVLDLAGSGALVCRVEEAPLADVNAALDRMKRGDIRGRIVLRCC
jgi:propanol-preferring alcohol dehydrogenase